MTSRSKKYNYNINASGDFATNNLNLGVANMFSGSFSASNSVVTPTDVTGLSFNSVAVRSFQCQMTVTIDRTIGGSLYETFTIEGHQTASGWGLYITSLGDITGVTFTITSVGQVRYTSTTVANFVSSMFRFTVTQITNSGTYASLNSSTGGTYLLNSVQITNTVASVLGTDPGALYVLGGSTFEKAITIKTTDNAIGLGTGGGLSIFGGAAVSKDLLVGGNLGIGTASPSTTLDITGTARVSGVISAGTMVGTTFTGGTLALSGSITAPSVVATTVSAGTSVVTTRTGGTLALSGSITVANIVTPGTVSAGTSVVTTRTGGTLALSGSITAPSVIATTVSAGTSVVTTRTGGTLALSGSITAPSVIATTVSAGTSVVTTRTGGTLALSGSITAANIVTPGTVSAGTMVGTTFTGGALALSGSITAPSVIATTVSAGTSVVTTRTGGSMALSGSITVANIVVIGNTLIGSNIEKTDYIRLNTSANYAIPPAASGTVNGVNITALNRRTRASNRTQEMSVGTWTQRTLPSSQNWNTVVWAAELGIFCVISGASSTSSDVAATSPDGITWTQRTLPISERWLGLTWAAELGLFCAVGGWPGTSAATSPDGITWTLRTLPVSSFWSDVCWAAELGMFCAVAQSSSVVATSPDGITWTSRTLPNSGNWQSVTWAPELGLFCVIRTSNVNTALTSPDGITWTTRTLPVSANWNSVSWSPELGIFCAISGGSNTDVAVTSPDGITWTQRTLPSLQVWRSVCWSAELGLFCAVGTNVAATSQDGVTWIQRTISASVAWSSVVWAAELGIFCSVTFGINVAISTPVLPAAMNTIKAPVSQISINTSGNLIITTSISTASITATTSSAGTSVVTTRTGGSMALSGSITAPSVIATTVSAGTMVGTTFTGGSMALSGSITAANIVTPGTVSAGTSVVTTRTGGSMALSGSITAANIVIPSTLRATGTSNTIANIFTTGGNVGIGLTTPTQQFQVSGNIGVENGYFEGLNESNNITGNTEWTLIRARNGAGIWGYKGASNHQGSLIFKTHSLFNTPVERLRITEFGGVGIGTSSPEYMLDVNTLNVAFRTGLTGGWRTQWNYSGSTGETTFFNYRGGGTGGIWFKNLNTSNQDVGWSNVICGSITSNPRTTYGAGNVNGLVLYNGQYDGNGDSTSILFDHSVGGFSQNRGSGITSICPSGTYGQVVDMYFSTGASGVYSEKMRIQGNGNVGIGTSSPSSRLSVNGNINLSSYGQRVGFDVESDWWNYNGNVVGHYSLGWYGGIFGSPATAVLSGYQGVVLASEGIPRFTVRRDGRIGIATTAPVTTLHANGTTLISNGILHARDYGSDGRHCIMFGSGEWGKNFGITSAFSMRYYSNGGDGAHAYTTIATYRASTYGGGVGMDTRISTTGTFTDFLFLSGEHRIGINTVPSYELHLNSDSAAKPNGGTWTTASDRRLKTGITMANLSICYDNIKAIPLKRYTWRDDVYTHEQVADRSKLGWIAQDVETVIPKAVDQKTMYGIEDCRSLNSDQIIATLYGCVQKLIEKVEDLETKQTETDTVIQKLRAKFPGEF